MADYEVIAEETLTSTAASIDITLIPATFSHLELVINARNNSNLVSIQWGTLTVNGLGSTIYGATGYASLNGSLSPWNHTPSSKTYVSPAFTVIRNGMPANTYGITKWIFPNYANTSVTAKGVIIQNSSATSTNAQNYQFVGLGTITTSAAINRITFTSPDGSNPLMAGTSYYLAGWK